MSLPASRTQTCCRSPDSHVLATRTVLTPIASHTRVDILIIGLSPLIVRSSASARFAGSRARVDAAMEAHARVDAARGSELSRSVRSSSCAEGVLEGRRTLILRCGGSRGRGPSVGVFLVVPSQVAEARDCLGLASVRPSSLAISTSPSAHEALSLRTKPLISPRRGRIAWPTSHPTRRWLELLEHRTSYHRLPPRSRLIRSSSQRDPRPRSRTVAPAEPDDLGRRREYLEACITAPHQCALALA